MVVADGRKAILFRSRGKLDDLTLQEERRLSPKDLNDDGPSGSRPEDQSPRQTDEATFAKQLANALYKMKESGAFSDLVC
ncbi:MAG: host attachment protein [Nitrobacter sp.]